MIKKLSILLFFISYCVFSVSAQQNEKLTFGGFGELHYNKVIYNANSETTPGVLDFHRFVLSAEYKFNDWISFKSALNLNHTLTGPSEGGTLALEQAYLDLKLQPQFGIRAGLLLVPSGIINLSRDPTSFHGVDRPSVEHYLIPTTWRESGLGIYGETQFGLNYEAYVMAGLKPNEITGEHGIREARQHGFKSSTANIAFTAGVDYELNADITLGASYYISTLKNEIENGNAERISDLDKAIFNMGEGHIQYQKDRFEARGLFALSRILDVEDLNRVYGNNAGQIQAGGYLEFAYDILPFFVPVTDQELYAFGRYESFDTNFRTGNEILRSNEYLRDEFTFGFSYMPLSEVVFKIDYQILTSFVSSRYFHQLNLGFGYKF